MKIYNPFKRQNKEQQALPVKQNVVAAVQNEKAIQSYENSNITFSGELSGYDYSAILRDKQNYINDLYKLADYYVDQDPIVHGIVKHVYVPYAAGSPYFLSGQNKKTIAIFEEQYKKMRLREKIEDIFYQYFKYGNVFIYIYKGNIITLPVHKCKIGNTMLNGTPVVDFDVQSLTTEFRQKSYSIKQTAVKDSLLQTMLKGYPDEVRKAVAAGEQRAQLNPQNTFVMQSSKQGWMRYAVPFIASCLPALAKKELIASYQTSLLNLGIRSFVLTTYGDEKKGQDMLPGREELSAVQAVVRKAMSGFPLAVTNHLADAKIIQADLSDLFQFDKYRQVNNDILAAGGIAGIIVNGQTQDGSTFASAQVSVQAAAARIEAARREFCEMMDKVNIRLVEDLKLMHTNNLKKIPTFHFAPLDMNGQKSLRDSCKELWQLGLVSTQTYMQTNGYSTVSELEKIEYEANSGITEMMTPRVTAYTLPKEEAQKNNSGGRPQKDEDERTSDPQAAQRGKQPKPSNPDGSQEE